MAKYAETGQETAVSSSFQTILSLQGGTGVRPRLYDVVFGAGGTPADNAIQFTLQRSTTAGTAGSSVTPAPLDPADPAAECTAGQAYSSEPTYTAATELLDVIINQRSVYRWVAAPGGELIIPASANAGIGMQVKHASYTGTAEATFHHAE